jgi:hypothetical protein
VDVRDSSGNQTTGRIAYYIDDEGTKINLNSLAGNKTTLNAGYGKAQSLSGVVSSTIHGSANFTGNLTVVDSIINGTASSNNTSITNWTSFFRPEQAQVSLSINASQIKHYSTAPPSDFHLKYTPWGTQRLFINDEPINDTGVRNIFSALTGLNATTGNVSSSPNNYEINGMALRNIYNGTFSDKYSSNGTLQIAANMLQLSDPMTTGPWNWVNCSGPMLGAANLTDSDPIPRSYFGYAPIVAINEVAIQAEKDDATGRLYICAYVELYSPIFDAGDLWYTLKLDFGGGSFVSGNSTVSFPSQSITRAVTSSAYRRNVDKFILGNQSVTSFNGTLSATMGNIRVLASGGNASTIRDWIAGSVINNLLPISNLSLNSTTMANYTASAPWNTSANMTSIQRKDVRIRQDSSGNYSFSNNSTTSPWAVALHTLPPQRPDPSTGAVLDYNKILAQCTYSNHNEFSDNALNMRSVSQNPFLASSYFSSDWPADQTNQGDALSRMRFFNYNRYNYPLLFATDASGRGLYLWPGDLGKPMTDRMFRSLRMFWQPPQERAKGFIPDWALIDLVSFSSNQSTKLPLKIAPMNLNGSFNCLSAPIPRPRNNIQCLTKPLDYSINIASSLANSVNATAIKYKNWDISYFSPASGAGVSASLSANLTKHITSNSSIAWSQTGNQTWNTYRTSKSWPSRQILIPSEVTELVGMSDFEIWPTSGATSERLENRLAAFFPGLTLCSNFFTIYAYAQALDKSGNVDSEVLAKTLVEVEITTPATATTGAVYKVKKLYTQPIPLGQ